MSQSAQLSLARYHKCNAKSSEAAILGGPGRAMPAENSSDTHSRRSTDVHPLMSMSTTDHLPLLLLLLLLRCCS